MTYASVVEIAASPSLRNRITAAAAQESVPNPEAWVSLNMWSFASQPDWAEAWDYAKATYSLDNNPDTGARPGVINDSMILAAVQALKP